MGNDGDLVAGVAVVLFIFGMIEVFGMINGHTRDDIEYKHIAQALEVCEGNGGLRKIEGETLGPHEFICHNGAVFTYKTPKTEVAE